MTAEILANGDWACVVNTCEDCDIYPRMHGAWIVRGHGAEIINGNHFYEEDEMPMPYDCCGALLEPRIAATPDSENFVTGTAPGRWGVESTADLVLFPYIYHYWVGDHFMSAFPQSFDRDSLDLMSAASLGGMHHQRIPVDCVVDCLPDTTSWADGMHPSLMLMTRGRRILTLIDDQLFEMNSDNTRTLLANVEQGLGWWPPIGDTHADHGFAYLLTSGQSLMLHRVDTLGSTPATAGTVGGNINANSASVNFSTNGDLFVCDGTNESSIGLAVIPWNAPLDAQEPPILPSEFSLTTYPNPFNSTVRIDFELPRASDVRVSIFNTLGEQVATLFNGHTSAGTHTLSWSPNSASGVYFVKLSTGEFVTSRKILYIR